VENSTGPTDLVNHSKKIEFELVDESEILQIKQRRTMGCA
jgi:hypothetical protein